MIWGLGWQWVEGKMSAGVGKALLCKVWGQGEVVCFQYNLLMIDQCPMIFFFTGKQVKTHRLPEGFQIDSVRCAHTQKQTLQRQLII
jgi:hypothetical protein